MRAARGDILAQSQVALAFALLRGDRGTSSGETVVESNRCLIPRWSMTALLVQSVKVEVCDVEAGSLLYKLLFETEDGSMMAVAAVFDGIPCTRVNKNRFHGQLALFPV